MIGRGFKQINVKSGVFREFVSNFISFDFSDKLPAI